MKATSLLAILAAVVAAGAIYFGIVKPAQAASSHAGTTNLTTITQGATTAQTIAAETPATGIILHPTTSTTIKLPQGYTSESQAYAAYEEGNLV